MSWPEVMVTAHRQMSWQAADWARTELPRVLQRLGAEHGMTRATTGMATGGDQVFGEVVQQLGLPLRAVIPYREQYLDGDGDGRFGRRWSKAQRATWQQLTEYARATGGAHELVDHYPRSYGERVNLLHKRNDWMLARSQAVIALWFPVDKQGQLNNVGGTYSAIVKAVGAGLPVILFDLVRQRVSLPTPEHWADRLDIPVLATARALW